MTRHIEDSVQSGDPSAPLAKGTLSKEALSRPAQSYAKATISSFLRTPLAVFGVIVVLLMTLLATFGPMLSSHSYDKQNLSYVNLPPTMKVSEADGRFFYATQNLKVVELRADGSLVGSIDGGVEDPVKKRVNFDLDGTKLSLDYKSKPAKFLYDGQPVTDTKQVWNKEHVLGTDGLGRDILTRLMFGMRISLTIAVIAMAVNLLIGVVYGGISGFFSGNVDAVMMRVVDIVSTIPLILYVVLIQVLLSNFSEAS